MENLTVFKCCPNEYLTFGTEVQHDDKPYHDDECKHVNRFENRGVLTCQDCCAVYDDVILEWRPG